MYRSILAAAGASLLAGAPASAQLASQSTVFDGQVGAICRVGTPIQANTPLAFVNDALSGATGAFSFESNGPVSLQLRQVQINASPNGTGNYTYDLGLNVHNGARITGATQAGASAVIPYANGLAVNDNFAMDLTISPPQGTLMAQGVYQVTATVDCLAQ